MIVAANVVEPISLGLKIAFVAVLYLFLLWIARSALKDLGRTSAQVSSSARSGPEGGLAMPSDATGMFPAAAGVQAPATLDPRLVVERAPGHVAGMEYEIGDGAVLGRGDQAEIRLEDPFASSRHARLVRQGSVIVLEDLGSTNGTYLNEELVAGTQALRPGDRVRIGDSEFTYQDR